MSRSKIVFPVANYNKDLYDFTIYFYDDASITYNGTIVKVGSFVFGNGSEDDEVMYPSETKFEFILSSLDIATTQEVIEKIQTLITRLQVSRHYSTGYGAELLFDGIVDSKVTPQTLDIKEQVIKIKATDHVRNIPSLITKEDDPGNFVLIRAQILELLLDSFLSYNVTTDVYDPINYTAVVDWQVEDTDNVLHQLDSMYILKNGLFHPDVPFTTKKDVLYALFANLAAYGMMAPFRSFYLMPRYYDGSALTTIYKKDLLDDPQFSFFGQLEDYVALAHDGANVYHEQYWRGEQTKKLYFPFPDGGYDDYSTLYSKTIQTDVSPQHIKRYSAQIIDNTGTYSSPGSFIELVDSFIYDRIGKLRGTAKIKLGGRKTLSSVAFADAYAIDRWKVFKFYNFDFLPGMVFRVSKATYDIVHDKVELILKQC